LFWRVFFTRTGAHFAGKRSGVDSSHAIQRGQRQMPLACGEATTV